MKYASNIDLQKNQLQNAVVHPLSSAPSSPVEGQIYTNTTDHHPWHHDGTTFKDLTDALTVGGQNSAYHLARANHSGTQTSATISDFNSATDARVALIVDAAPGTLDTLNELAAALGDDPDFAATTAAAIGAKVTANGAITGATKTKVTYDAKGLVTAGADATTADIADSSNKRYVTDANLVTIGNQSGTNTGDQVISDATITTTDITTNNATASKHGFLPKLSNSATEFLNGTGVFSVPAGGGTVNKYAADVGDNAAVSFVITHSLGSRDVIVTLYRSTTPWDVVVCDVEHTSTTTVTLRFAVAPTTAQFRVVVTA